MSTRFAELMAISATQTKESDVTTKAKIEEKRRKEEQRKKELEEKERREREFQARLVKRRMEEQLRGEERKKKAEEERQRKEQIIAKREEEQRKALLYGPRSRSGGGSGSGTGAGRSRKGRGSGSDDDLEAGAMALTREEKRQRKLMLDMNRSNSIRRSTGSSYIKPGRVLKGGAVDAVAPQKSGFSPSGMSEAALAGLSIKERIALTPNYLQPLNTKKRDVRTIDEILRDRQKEKESKILAGEEAREFHDWFGSNKKKAEPPSPAKKATSSQSSVSPSPSRALTPNPVSTSSKSTPVPARLYVSAPIIRTSTPDFPPKPERKEPRTKVTIVKPEPKGSINFQKVSTVPKASPSVPLARVSNGSSKSTALVSSRTSSSLAQSTSSRKRARSYGDDDDSELDSDDLDSPPPHKRRPGSSAGRNSISSEIWKLFGKDRDRYVKEDVYSDEEDDMEADADALRREELRRSAVVNSFYIFSYFSHSILLTANVSRREKMSLPWKKKGATKKRRRGRERRRTGDIKLHFSPSIKAPCFPLQYPDFYRKRFTNTIYSTFASLSVF